SELVVDACGQSSSDEFRRSLMLSLLAGGKGYHLPIIKGLLQEVWPQRYTKTQGQSILFREPGDLVTAMDYYCQNAYLYYRPGTGYLPGDTMLRSLVDDTSLPAGYRAFLLVYWPAAPSWFSRGFVESMLLEDMPDFIRDALTNRLLLDWTQE
ncbi:MAG: hypothetical protein ABFE13_04220, partial [Phycisphaerales bacterium]